MIFEFFTVGDVGIGLLLYFVDYESRIRVPQDTIDVHDNPIFFLAGENGTIKNVVFDIEAIHGNPQPFMVRKGLVFQKIVYLNFAHRINRFVFEQSVHELFF